MESIKHINARLIDCSSDTSFTHCACPILSQLIEATPESDKKVDLLRWLHLYGWTGTNFPSAVDRHRFANALTEWSLGNTLPERISESTEGLERFRRKKAEGQRVTFTQFEGFLDELVPIFGDVTKILQDQSLLNKLEASRGVIKERKVRVVITALMKAGKSTLLNSLVGEELLPSDTFAATAAITKIVHHSRRHPTPDFPEGWKSYLEDGGKRYEGTDIFAHLKTLNDQVRSRMKSEGETERELPVVTVHTCLPFLDGHEFVAVEGIDCELYDTPGVDEAGISNLNQRIEKNILGADVLVYLLDCQRIGSDRDASYLKTWFERRPEFTDISTRSDCCLFVGNKMDATTCDPSDMLAKMQAFVEAAVNGGNPSAKPRFQPQQFVVCSAQRAFLCRTFVNKTMTPSGKTLWNDLMKKYGKKPGKEDKLLKLFSDHMVDNLESSLCYLIWNQRLSVTLETHVQHISNATLHAWNQLQTIISSIAHKNEAEKRLNDAIPIMAETRRRLITKLDYLLTEYVRHISEFINKEIHQWETDNKEYLNSLGVEGNMTATSDVPLKKLISDLHQQTSSYILQGREKMQGKLRALITQLQMVISQAVKGELQEIYKFLHQSIDNVLSAHLSPLLQYLDAELPELDPLECPVNGYVELVSRTVRGEPLRRPVVKTKMVQGCVGSRREEYNDIEIVESQTQEEYFQVSLDRFRKTWADYVERSSVTIYENCTENMKNRKKAIEEQAVKSIDSYLANYKKAMDPSKYVHADSQLVKTTIERLEPFCERIAEIVDAINLNNKTTHCKADDVPQQDLVAQDAVQAVASVSLASAPAPPPLPEVQTRKWVQRAPLVRKRTVQFRDHNPDLIQTLREKVLSRRPSIVDDSADVGHNEEWKD